MIALWWVLQGPLGVRNAHAELLPRDYHTELANAAADTIGAMAKAQQIDEAEAFAARWRKTIGVTASAEDAKLSYELGLGWRLAGRPDRALRALDAALGKARDARSRASIRGEGGRVAAAGLAHARDRRRPEVRA